MGYLKGTIQPTMQTELPAGSIIRIIVFRVPTTPNTRRTADMIGRGEIPNARQFPVDFGINYDDVESTSAAEYAIYITVYVEKGSRILLSNVDENRGHTPSSPTLSSNRETYLAMDPLLSPADDANRVNRRMHMGNEYGDLVGRNGKFRRHLDVFLSESSSRN